MAICLEKLKGIVFLKTLVLFYCNKLLPVLANQHYMGIISNLNDLSNHIWEKE